MSARLVVVIGLAVGLLAGPAASAAAASQTFAEGVRAVCAGETPTHPRASRLAWRVNGSGALEARRLLLRASVATAGLARCRLLDRLRKQGDSPVDGAPRCHDDAIRIVLDGRRAEIDRCFAHACPSKPWAEGLVALRWRMRGTRWVEAVRADASLVEAARVDGGPSNRVDLGRCIERALVVRGGVKALGRQDAPEPLCRAETWTAFTGERCEAPPPLRHPRRPSDRRGLLRPGR